MPPAPQKRNSPSFKITLPEIENSRLYSGLLFF